MAAVSLPSTLASTLLRTRERSRVVAGTAVEVCDTAAHARAGSVVARARSTALRRHSTEPSRFALHGEIDVANADQLLTALRRAGSEQPGGLVVDCSDLQFIDAAGISTLVQAHGELDTFGRTLRLVHPSPFLTRVLQLLQITYLLGAVPLAPVAA